MDISDLAEKFEFVDTVSVERTANGQIALKMPQHRYAKADDTPVHAYGWGPFCKFQVDTSDYQGTAGVYMFTANHQVVYIGEAIDIHRRIYGYANISPKNCFAGGQQTNCRINNAILAVIHNGGQVALWAMASENRKQQEAALIEACEPPWNVATPPADTSQQHQDTRGDVTDGDPESPPEESTTAQQQARSGKYAPLYDYLKNTDSTTIQVSFEEIENRLGVQLPASARKYEVWWNPTGHLHAEGWAELGWTANPDLDAETVTFEKTE